MAKKVQKAKARNLKIAKSEVFFEPIEWRKVRYQTLLKHGRTCQCCGAKGTGVILQVDHIKPRSKYPHLALDLNNLQVLCKDCNLGKLGSV